MVLFNLVSKRSTAELVEDLKMSTSKKVNPKKQKLIQLSAQAKQVIKTRVAESKTDVEAMAAASLRVNDVLMEFHRETTGASDFKTFKEWSDLGYKIKKGSKAVQVWAAPRQGTNEIEVKEIKSGDTKTIEEQYQFFPMCSLFNENQVELTEA